MTISIKHYYKFILSTIYPSNFVLFHCQAFCYYKYITLQLTICQNAKQYLHSIKIQRFGIDRYRLANSADPQQMQSDQGLHFILFYLHHLDTSLPCTTKLLHFHDNFDDYFRNLKLKIFYGLTCCGSSKNCLTHSYLETHKKVIGKQCRPRSDAT